MQYDGDVARVLYCKAWILGVAAMHLLAHNRAYSEAPERDGTREVLRSLLEASAAAGGPGARTRAGVPAASQLRSALLTTLQDLQSVTARDLSTAWADEQVRSAASNLTGTAALVLLKGVSRVVHPLDQSGPLPRRGERPCGIRRVARYHVYWWSRLQVWRLSQDRL